MESYKAIAAYYDAECVGISMLEHDVPFFLGQLPGRRQSVLELCVGTGRAAIPIAVAGHRVVGVDYDPELLAIAGPKRDAAGLTGKQLELVHGDATAVSLGRRFDWVCVFFNTLVAFPSLAEMDLLLGVARDHLRPGGRLWVDVFNPDPARLAVPRATGVQPWAFYVPGLNRTVYNTTDLRIDLAAQTQRVTFNYQWFDPRGRRHRERTRFTLTWLWPRELQLVMERNGLRVEQTFGNYDGSPVASDSPRIIARCRRA